MMRPGSPVSSNDASPNLGTLQQLIGHRFSNQALLVAAVTHRSFAHEAVGKGCKDNESLEFLGDAVLAFVIARELYQRFPGLDEGRLSKHKSMLEKASTLADAARALGLGTHLRLGKGEHKSGGARNDKILSNAFEALVAATFLDGGMEAASLMIERSLGSRLEALDAQNPINDYKSALQEVTQARGLGTPRYVVVGETGPDHDKRFTVCVLVDEKPLAEEVGCTKRGAQQLAARSALERLQAE